MVWRSGLNYRYTGTDHVAQGWPERFNCVIGSSHTAQELTFAVNRHSDGQQHGWHRDDEAGCAGNIAR